MNSGTLTNHFQLITSYSSGRIAISLKILNIEVDATVTTIPGYSSTLITTPLGTDSLYIIA